MKAPEPIRTLPLVPADMVRNGINYAVRECHARAYNNGWWTDKEGNIIKIDPTSSEGIATLGWKLLLIVTEIAEAAEGTRKRLPDDHLPQYSMLDVELADAFIRICDLAGAMDIPLQEIVLDKLDYNDQRADHKPENRAKAGGKEV